MASRRHFLASLAASTVAAGSSASPAAADAGAPLTVFHRTSDVPLITPRGKGFEGAGTFNPAAVSVGDGTVLIYRAQDAMGTSRLGYAKSTDGVTFVRRPDPVFSPKASYERAGGVEDPRIVKIDGTYLMTYTAYDSIAQTAQLCLATSHDLIAWERQGILLPANVGSWNVHWTKSGAIVPQKIGGRWWMYYLGESGEEPAAQMGVAVSDDLFHWKDATKSPVVHTRPRSFDSQVCEPGPAPIVTSDGILLIYNGADDGLVYSTGWVLFDLHDPTKVIARSSEPLFGPDRSWERIGQVPNVVFVEGMTRDGDQLTLYYGAADTNIGSATSTLKIR